MNIWFQVHICAAERAIVTRMFYDYLPSVQVLQVLKIIWNIHNVIQISQLQTIDNTKVSKCLLRAEQNKFYNERNDSNFSPKRSQSSQGQKLLGQVNLTACYVLLTDEKIVDKPNCLHILYPHGKAMRSIYVCANSVRVRIFLSCSFTLLGIKMLYSCYFGSSDSCFAEFLYFCVCFIIISQP